MLGRRLTHSLFGGRALRCNLPPPPPHHLMFPQGQGACGCSAVATKNGIHETQVQAQEDCASTSYHALHQHHSQLMSQQQHHQVGQPGGHASGSHQPQLAPQENSVARELELLEQVLGPLSSQPVVSLPHC